MSTLNVSNITDGTDTVETGYVLNGSAKAWADWDAASTPVINESLNASSLVDDGTGDQTLNFANSFAANTFSASNSGNRIRNSTSWGWFVTDYKRTASYSRVRCSDAPYTLYDFALVNISMQGDLA